MLPNNHNEPIYSCKLTCDKVRRVITSQLTISSTLVTLLFLCFHPPLPLHNFLLPSFSRILPSLSFSLRGDAVTYARLQHQKQGDEERMTGTTNGAPEWGACLPTLSSLVLTDAFSPCTPSIVPLHSILSSLPPLTLHNNGICFINFLELLHSCCPDLIVSKQIGVGFSPLFGTWHVNGGLSLWIDTSDYKFCFSRFYSWVKFIVFFPLLFLAVFSCKPCFCTKKKEMWGTALCVAQEPFRKSK